MSFRQFKAGERQATMSLQDALYVLCSFPMVRLDLEMNNDRHVMTGVFEFEDRGREDRETLKDMMLALSPVATFDVATREFHNSYTDEYSRRGYTIRLTTADGTIIERLVDAQRERDEELRFARQLSRKQQADREAKRLAEEERQFAILVAHETYYETAMF